jgi:hypothetical protein
MSVIFARRAEVVLFMVIKWVRIDGTCAERMMMKYV